MNLDNQYQIANLAYKNGNFDESYQLANIILSASDSDSEISSKAWILKGLSCGYLSTPRNMRFDEMISCIEKGKKLANHSTQDRPRLAHEIALLTSSYVALLGSYYQDSNKQSLQTLSPRRVEIRNASESFSESVGRQIGQTAADVLIVGALAGVQTRKNSAVLGREFLSTHAQQLKNTMVYAFNCAPNDSTVASLLAKSINTVVDINNLSPGARRKFTDSLDKLITSLITMHNTDNIYFIKTPNELFCPECFHTVILQEKRARGCLYDLVMTIITLGLYLIIDKLLGDDTETAKDPKPGTLLTCATCEHQWTHP